MSMFQALGRQWWMYGIALAIARPFTKTVQQAASTSYVSLATSFALNIVYGLLDHRVYVALAPVLEGVGGLYVEFFNT